ncbi:hypothetical protein IFM89_015525 [Coptis chinensis]|uniref:Sulfite reductase [NADPH] flavoprotein alpha-component-like FAD-binding domain-containing protein n=1 Tax=Coptis chinensis TaxID=261450 RepID=A0A835IX23_9MAGN|nr:hypothetical protein IFM89_015525 [Coptis chinensis]
MLVSLPSLTPLIEIESKDYKDIQRSHKKDIQTNSAKTTRKDKDDSKSAELDNVFTLYSQSALLALATHASDSSEAYRLRNLASPAGKLQVREVSLRSWMSFHQRKSPLGVFFSVIAPRLQPRYYSISSSSR